MDLDEIVRNSIGEETTIDKTIFWFDVFNEIIFDNKLSYFDDIIIKRTRGYYGMCLYYEWVINGSGDSELILQTYELVMRKNLDFKLFLETLGHEMVHLYQGQVQENYDFPEPEEDETFYEFQEKFKMFGICIL